jgi:hypothetical protein
MMMRKSKPEDDKGKIGEVQMRTSVSTLSTDPQPPLLATTIPTTTTTSTTKDNKDKDKASGGDTISAVRGGVLKNGIYYSESELAEQGAITWNPCYWTKERISKWVDEVEHPDTLKTIAKSLSPTNGTSS